MARPKKEKELRRTHPVMLRFTDTECERLLAFLAEMFPDYLCIYLIIFWQCYLYRSHCTLEITFCGINNFPGISKTC